MGDLFRRSYRLTVEDVAISDLDISFSVDRTIKKQPSTADISIYNLDPDRRQRIEERGAARVVLEAGYEMPEGAARGQGYSDRGLIYAGDLREVYTDREGADLITHLTSGDGEKKHRQARVQKSFAPSTSIKAAIRACADALGVGVGNLDSITRAEFPGVGAVFPCGTVLSGSAAEELDGLLRSAGLEYSIQNGALQIRTRRQALEGEAVVLGPETGLIGNASVSSDLTLKATCLMIPDIFPGRRIKVLSEAVFGNILAIQSRGQGRRHLHGFSGFFRVNNARYSGDTSGNDWQIDIEGEPLFRVAA